MCDQRANIGTIGFGTGFKEVQKYVARLKNTGVIGKQAKHDTGQEHFRLVASVVVVF
ncbi:MAG: hypothetical protein QM492_09060 [Rhodobacterales bacterium]